MSEDGRMGGFIISFSDFDFPKEKNFHSSLSGFDDEPRALEASWLLCLEECCALEDIQSCMNWGTERDSRIGGAADCRGATGWRSDWRGATRRCAFSGRREA